MRKFYLLSVILLFLLLAICSSCGKTDEDREQERLLAGQWYTTEILYSLSVDTVYFTFGNDNKGSTSVGGKTDELSWEIVRGTLKTYYKTAPSYTVGYDKYNSKGVYDIDDFRDNEVDLRQYFYNGIQTEFTIYRRP
ncbi:MAG: hypothetical protein ABIJ16_14375 [Bacteroidota bacterium]